jgi:uncharacterized membrane protein YecN with MAPEG domain
MALGGLTELMPKVFLAMWLVELVWAPQVAAWTVGIAVVAVGMMLFVGLVSPKRRAG